MIIRELESLFSSDTDGALRLRFSAPSIPGTQIEDIVPADLRAISAIFLSFGETD